MLLLLSDYRLGANGYGGLQFLSFIISFRGKINAIKFAVKKIERPIVSLLRKEDLLLQTIGFFRMKGLMK